MLLLFSSFVNAEDVYGGHIADAENAKQQCPNVCAGKGLKWNSHWTKGEMATCGYTP